MSLHDYLKDDPRQELAFALVLTLATVMRWTERIGDWPFVALVGVALVTLLGTRAYRGLRAGPSGLEIGGRDDDIDG